MLNHAPKWILFASTAGLLAVTAAWGQVARERSSTTTTTTRSGSKTEIQKISTIMKSKVLIQDDQNAGKVVDFVLSDGGCLDYIVASYEDDYYVIPFSAATLRYDDSVVFVDISRSTFRNLQFFSSNNWPDLHARSFQDKVFSSFNVSSTRREGQTTFKRETGTDRTDADRKDRDVDRKDRDVDRKDRDADRKDSDPRDSKNRDAEKRDRDSDRTQPDAKRDDDRSDKTKPDAKREDAQDRKDAPGTKPAPKSDQPKTPGTLPKRDDDKNPPKDKAPSPKDKEPKKP